MTQPERLPPGDETPDAETIAFEVSSVEIVTGELSALLLPALASIVGAYAAGFAGSAISELVEQTLKIDWSPMGPKLSMIAQRAIDLGTARAMRGRGETEGSLLARTAPGVGPMSAPEVGTIDSAAKGHLDTAVNLARTLPMTSMAHIWAVVGQASRARTGAEGATRAIANRGINHGTAAMASRLGLNLIWVVERDACLHCLAHAGWVIRPGQAFPPVTFADKPLNRTGVPYPPLHPNCRCQVRPYDGATGAPTGDRSRLDPAARLRAEAQRSVVYQWADASMPAGMRAAIRLLEQGTVLAPSVEARARRKLATVKRRTVRK